jgi:hypothetical protein
MASAEVEQFGDLGDSVGAGADVAHGGAKVAVAGLGHDGLEKHVLRAKVSGGRVAELVEARDAELAALDREEN